MATLRIKFLATSIQMQMHLQVFLPETIARPGPASNERLKVLWLLHGEGGDCSDWTRLSMIEHYAQEANIALVMPDLANSMCMNMVHGGYPYFTYLTQDLPRHIHHLVHVLSDRREDNFVAGVSTGGYGAVKWMLSAPQMFSGCVCLSGDIDMVAALREKKARGDLTDAWIAAFGDAATIAGTPDDTLHLCEQHAKRSHPISPIHVAFSRQDEGLERKRDASRKLRDLGLPVHVHEEANGQGWPLWDARMREFIRSSIMTER
jgi:S-formylglutathione hydrolase FrmB